MITAAIWNAICDFLSFLLGLFPTMTLPTWIGTVSGYIASGVETANGLHNWIPLEALRNGFVFVAACGATVLAVRGFRILLSLFTGGGGGAA